MSTGAIQYRAARTSDADAMSDLVLGLAEYYLEDPGNPGAASGFFEEMAPDPMRARLEDPDYEFVVAVQGKAPVGFIGFYRKTHLYQLFVQQALHGQGLGCALWRAATEQSELPTMTVNASHFAVPFYERLGFRIAADPVTKAGLAWVPMRRDAAGQGG